MMPPIPQPDSTAPPSGPTNPLAALRRIAKPRPQNVERCEMCSAQLPAEHAHLLDVTTRQLQCACDACALLFAEGHHAKLRRVPRRIEHWTDFRLTDEQWSGLHLPINLAFFYTSTPERRVTAMYPSPAGATESLLPLDTWQDLVRDNPRLANLEPDVEALIVNRIKDRREYFRAPIDQCYRLVGLIRAHWRGLSGGMDVWRHIDAFFDDLHRRADPPRRN